MSNSGRIIEYPIGGYAPGNYINTCIDCKEYFLGDKKAVQCEACAVIEMVEDKAETDQILKEAKEKALRQETFEEAAQWLNKKFEGRGVEIKVIDWGKNEKHNYSPTQLLEEYAKWKTERMYSEEELRQAFRDGENNMHYSDNYGLDSTLTELQWFEKFKKK